MTEDGVEVLTARLADSPGGPVSMPGEAIKATEGNATNGTATSTNGVKRES